MLISWAIICNTSLFHPLVQYMMDVYLVGILSQIGSIICVHNMTLLNHQLSSLTNVGGLTDTEEGLMGFSTTAYLESGSGSARTLSLERGETFFGAGRTPSDLSVRKYLKYVDHNSCLTSWNLYIEPNGEIWLHLKKPGIDAQYNTGCSLAPNTIFAWRLDHNDSSDSDNNYRMHLYMYTTGDSCDGTLMHYDGNPTSDNDCSGDHITVRFFYNWTGGTIYEMTHNGDRDSTSPDCCHDGNLDYYPGYPIHNMAFLFRGATPLINRIFGKTGKSDLAIKGSLKQGIEGYTEFSKGNYLTMTDAIGKGEFMDQYQIHHIYWIYLNNYPPGDIEILNIEFWLEDNNGKFFIYIFDNHFFSVKLRGTLQGITYTEYCNTTCIANLDIWFYLEVKVVGVDMTLSPNDIYISVQYANGDMCSESCTNLGTDLSPPIGDKIIEKFEVGSYLTGILGGIESWRGWRNWTHTVTKNCHASCMPNWCLEDENPAACFPSGIYVLNYKSTLVGDIYTIYISRQFDSSTVISTCADILTSSPDLGIGPTCTYEQSTLALTLTLGTSHSVTRTSKICIDPTKALPATLITDTDLNCCFLGLANTSQIGDRFYFTFSDHYFTPVTDCSIVNVGLELLGTNPICNSTGNVLTIESNITDASYNTDDIIGINDTITTQNETLIVDYYPPYLEESDFLDTEWDAGEKNFWKAKYKGMPSYTGSEWTWTKISGPSLTFVETERTQTYPAESLELGASYEVSVSASFTYAPWLILTYQFTPVKMNFRVLSTTQSGTNFIIILSDSRVSITSCAHIFDAATVASLGTSATCIFDTGTSTLEVITSGDHSLVLGSTLVYSNVDLMSTTTNYILHAINEISIDKGGSEQEGNKFQLKLLMPLDSSKVVNTCADILTTSPDLGTDSACSYDQSTLTLTVYVGNGHQVTSASKLCIDNVKATPPGVITTADSNCMDVAIDLPTVAITAPTEAQQFLHTDSITISTTTANLTNVASHTFAFKTESGRTDWNFTGTNETSKTIPVNSLLPGMYVFKVYLNIGDSGDFSPNYTVNVEILYPTLTSTSQIGNRFYFRFSGNYFSPVIDCTVVNLGLGLLGTSPICSSTNNILTIESNLTDSTYVATNTIGIRDIITNEEEILIIDEACPSLTGSITPNNGEWDAGTAGNKFEVVVNSGGSLTLDHWMWTKVSGPPMTFTANSPTQAFPSESLQLGELYEVSVTATFTNAPWLSLTHLFSPQKMNFVVISNAQSESKLSVVLSDSRVSINTCSDIFNGATVSQLGVNASCIYTGGTKTLVVYASGDHTLILGSILVYSNPDLMGTPTFEIEAELPSASLSVNGGLWTLDNSLEYIFTINTADIGTITAPQITYQFTYISGPYTSYVFPNIIDNVCTISQFTLSPGAYEMKISMIIADYDNYTYSHSQSFTVKATKTELVNHGPKFNVTLNIDWPDIISSCSDIFEAGSIILLTTDSVCVRDENKKKCLYVFAGNSSTIVVGDSLALKAEYYNNNTISVTDSAPIFSGMTLSDPSKHWSRDQMQNVTAILANFAGLDTYFTITWEYMLRGESEVNIRGDSAGGLGSFHPYRIESMGNYILTGVITLADTWGSINYYQVVTDILAALPPFTSAKGMNASYPHIMPINLTSHGTLDKDTGGKSEDLSYKWEIFTDDQLTSPYAPWSIKTSENVLIAANYFPLGVYYAKLTVTKLTYFSSWTKGVLNISDSNTKLEISSSLSDLKADLANTFEASTISLDGSTDFPIHWEITPNIYNRYEQGAFLTVPPETFIPGGLYVLRCKILEDQGRRHLGNVSPEIAISMLVAQEINVGALLITPMIGDGLITDFSLDANTWSDLTGQPLKYRFSYQIVGATSENIFREWDYSNTATGVKIPPGKNVFYNTVEVKVEAKNEDNSMALVCKNITVKPAVIADKSVFLESYLGTALTPAENLTTISLMTFLVEVDVNYAKPDACGGCDPDHGSCNSTTQLCFCQEGYKLSSLCNIADVSKDKIAEVADNLATALVENSEAALKNHEDASDVFYAASNILSNQVPLPIVAKKIENMTYNFLEQILSNETENDEETKIELTSDLANSLMQTLGKIGGSIFIQKDNDLQNEGDPSKQSGDSPEDLEKRSQKYVDSVEKLSNKLVSNILPGTKVENIEAGSFTLSGGRFTGSGMSKKDLETEGGSKISTPVWEFGDENTLVKYKHLVFKKNPRMNMTNATIGNSQRFSISSEDDKILEIVNLTDPLNLQFTLTGLSNTTVEILKCSFYNSTLGQYSVAGMITISKSILRNGQVVITCQSNHLSEFALATDPALDTSGDTLTITDNNNLDTVAEMDKINEVEPTTSKGLWVLVSVTIAMLILIITFGVHECIKNKKKKDIESRTHEESPRRNKMKIPKEKSRTKIVPITITVDENTDDEGKITERDKLKNPRNLFPNVNLCEIIEEDDSVLPGKVIDLTAERGYSAFIQRPKSAVITEQVYLHTSESNAINLPPPINSEITKRKINSDTKSNFTIQKSEADTQTEMTQAVQKKEDIRIKGCCVTTMITIAECHGMINPFLDREGGIPRRDKFLIFYLEIILYIWITAVFFDRTGEEGVENKMTGIGLIILALSVILLTIPHILLLTKLLTRPPLPAKFLNNEGDKVIELLQEEERWRRKQCCWTILGYMFGWGMIVFFTCHILVMTIIMGESTTNSWLKALLITAIIDYCFLQTSKGIVLMCCLSEGFIDFVITIFAGHVI